MLLALVQDLVVHLVGVDDQMMLAGNLDDFVQQIIRIQGTGRVVRVDDDDGTGLRIDLATDIVEIRQPPLGFIAQVMLRRATGQADRRRP